MSPVQALVIDFIGVLAEPLPRDPAAWVEVAAAVGLTPPSLRAELYASPAAREHALGHISRAAWLRAALDALGLPEAEQVGLERRLFGGWQENAPLIERLVRLRRAGLRLAILSNGSGPVEALFGDPATAALFDLALFSGDVGLAKPDPAFFRLAERRLALPPAALFFVDDAAVNVAAARAVGWRGHHYTSIAALDVALAALGLSGEHIP